MFLGIGNTLGMVWAYEELGWGGYWGWDPVENAAFMPFLTASAYVHSVMIQERRGLLKVWNVFLISLTFFLTIFGTFLTRSGMIASVHSFAQSSIGTYFAVFLLLLVAFATTLVIWRWPELRDIKAEPTRALGGCRRRAGSSSRACLPGSAFLWRHAAVRRLARVPHRARRGRRRSSSALELVFRRMTQGLDVRTRRPHIESVFSREFTFLLNNWILCSLLFFILVATTFPLISEALDRREGHGRAALLQGVGPAARARAPVSHGRRHALRLEEDEPRRAAARLPRSRSSRSASPSCCTSPSAGRSASRRSCAATRSTRARSGPCCAAFNAFTPVMGFSLCVVQRGGHRAGVRAAVPRARPHRRRRARRPRILWWLGGLPGLRATRSSPVAPVAPPLRRLRRPLRHRAHVHRLHGPVVERRSRGLARRPGRATRSATTR